MGYLVTGATGFIGRYLVKELLPYAEGKPIYVVVRRGSAARLEELRSWWNARESEVIAIEGDLTASLCGVSEMDRARMRGQIEHFIHLAALYDLNARAAEFEDANVLGTRNALALASDLHSGCFHLCSSIAAAGRYAGVFREEMFDEAYGFDHAYFRTKHESEAIVRREARIPWRIFRPAMVVGHSETGHITKSDGPYHLFKTLQTLRRSLPAWVPIVGIEGGYVNVVPVDYVAKAMSHLIRLPGLNGRCFHLTDPQPRRAGELLNLFARAGHAPMMAVRLDERLLRLVPAEISAALEHYPPLRGIVEQLLDDLRLPREVLRFLDLPTLFDSTQTRLLLEAAGIRLPPLESYAWRLWDYWERNLDPDLSIDRSLRNVASGKRIMITGGSSGIGRATALMLAQAGARVILVARDPIKLEATRAEICAAGGSVRACACDITDPSACAQLVKQVNEEFGGLDVLINNAGRSIRRSISISYERLHDFERLMQLNYFAAVRLTLAFLPNMAMQGGGHVIVISSIGVLSNAPRFAGYVASKAALEAFARCAASEYRNQHVSFTVVNMPLVRTPMIEPTHVYDEVAALSVHEAAALVADAMIRKPPRVLSRLGMVAQALEVFAPRFADVLNSAYYEMFPDSSAARGEIGPDTPPTQDAKALAALLRGMHW